MAQEANKMDVALAVTSLTSSDIVDNFHDYKSKFCRVAEMILNIFQ